MSPGALAAHGGLDPVELRELGLDPARVLDFSANVNPLGPAPAVRRALRSADPSAYPDRRCTQLAAALAQDAGVAPERVLAGNGSTELIHLLARAYAGDGRCALVFAPAFGEYAAGVCAAGGQVAWLTASERHGFRWNLHGAVAEIARQRPALVFLANPNNPTGVYLPLDGLLRIAHAARGAGLLIVDEAYRGFVDGPVDPAPLLALDHVVLLRSMTKDHALAGVRLGYLLAAPDVVERVRRLQPAWSVSALAQAAGVAALGEQGHVARARGLVRRNRAYLLSELCRLGLPALDSRANFVLVRVGDAAGLRLRLLESGVAVRDCASFGLPAYIRVAVRRRGECRRLVAALEKALPHE